MVAPVAVESPVLATLMSLEVVPLLAVLALGVLVLALLLALASALVVLQW
jgi:hypothetical protein